MPENTLARWASALLLFASPLWNICSKYALIGLCGSMPLLNCAWNSRKVLFAANIEQKIFDLTLKTYPTDSWKIVNECKETKKVLTCFSLVLTL